MFDKLYKYFISVTHSMVFQKNKKIKKNNTIIHTINKTENFRYKGTRHIIRFRIPNNRP